MYITISDNELHERLNDLIKRRNVNLSENIKFRGRLRTSKWNMFQAAQKNQLLTNLDRNLKEQ